jgi:UDPglucose 6-dehydrogenase
MISIIGLGFVGSAIEKSFKLNGIKQYNYDKYRNIGTLEGCFNSDILFLCLPTVYSNRLKEYDKSSLHEVITQLVENKYNGVIVIKSTVEPKTTSTLYEKYSSKHKINIVHNPEFLTAATAFEDFHNQNHIVLGKHHKCDIEKYNKLKELYKTHYPLAKISECDSTESESMKLFVNNFYASKIQLFNEYYLLCKKTGVDYNRVKELMIGNDWINPMHTNVPGTDGQLSYGGYCFPKDTNALNEYMKREGTSHTVLNAVIKERNEMREDNTNVSDIETVLTTPINHLYTQCYQQILDQKDNLLISVNNIIDNTSTSL